MTNFHRFEESPLADFSIFNKFSKRPLLRLVLISVACVVVGAAAGLVLNYRTIQELRSEPVEVTLPVVEEKEEEKIATYSGTIKPSARSLYSEGTHYLEGEEGEVILLLEADDDKLEFSLGMEVAVEGLVRDTVEGGYKIMKVDRVLFSVPGD